MEKSTEIAFTIRSSRVLPKPLHLVSSQCSRDIADDQSNHRSQEATASSALTVRGCHVPAYQAFILIGGSGQLLVPPCKSVGCVNLSQVYGLTYRHDGSAFRSLYGPTTLSATNDLPSWRAFEDARRRQAEAREDGAGQVLLTQLRRQIIQTRGRGSEAIERL